VIDGGSVLKAFIEVDDAEQQQQQQQQVPAAAAAGASSTDGRERRLDEARVQEVEEGEMEGAQIDQLAAEEEQGQGGRADQQYQSVSKSQSTASGNNSWWATLSVSAMSAALGLQATVLNNGGVRKKKRLLRCHSVCTTNRIFTKTGSGQTIKKFVN
jgi:hypothetical protein